MSDQIPQETSQELTCPNCQRTFLSTATYCYQCGQKQGTKKRSLYQLFKDFLDNFFNLDTRVWRTLGNIFIPAKLTQEYFRGRYQSYTNPIRLFLITSIILFSILSFNGMDFLKLDLVQSDLWKQAEKGIYFEEFENALDSVVLVIKEEQNNPTIALAFDSLKQRMPVMAENRDSLNASLDINIGKWKLKPTDFVELREEEFIEKYKVEGFGMQLLMQRFVKMVKNSGNFANFIWSNFPLMLLFMMPGVALFLKVLYIRRDYYFVEHLVFSFHIHAFLFLLMSLLLLFPNISFLNWMASFSTIGFLFYLFVSFKRYYGQSTIKTLFKLLFSLLAYVLILVIAFLMTLVISAVLF